jgi:hypothetical protein
VEPVPACSLAATNHEADEPERERDDNNNPQKVKRKARPCHDEHYQEATTSSIDYLPVSLSVTLSTASLTLPLA